MPVTIETGVKGKNVNFYDPSSRFDYGVGYDMDGLELASQVADCRTVVQVEGEDYKVCEMEPRLYNCALLGDKISHLLVRFVSLRAVGMQSWNYGLARPTLFRHCSTRVLWNSSHLSEWLGRRVGRSQGIP